MAENELDLLVDDFNGETFLAGAAGEREEYRNTRVVAVPEGIPFSKGTTFDHTVLEHQRYLELFHRLNYWYIVANTVARAADPGGGAARPVRVPDAALAARIRKIAYVRTMSARMGHFHYAGTPAAHHTRYAEFRQFTFVDLQAFARRFFEDNRVAITDLESALRGIRKIPNLADDRAWMNAYRSKHLNVVCIIAYFFRVRGHHWIAEMDDRYKAVWHKCLYEEDGPGLDWQYLAHDALHAIFPDDLDAIWVKAAGDDACAGALVKRVNSVPAGVAIIAALNAGANDLGMIVPRAISHQAKAVGHLQQLTDQIKANRFAGSVNRRLYDAPDIVPNETLLGPLAAIILSSLDSFAPNSPLLKSAALKRVGNNAPMTGGVVGRMIVTAARSDAAAEVFLPEPAAAVIPAT